MSEAFLRQQEAWDFVHSIHDPTERLLVELSLAHALSFLVSDADYKARFLSSPLDLRTFASAIDAFLRKTDIVRKVLDGKITHVDDLSPFPPVDPSD